MPLLGTRLESAIKSAVRAELETQVKPTLPWADLSASQKAGISAGWDQIAAAVAKAGSAIVTEIQTNAVVNTAGSATAQVGTVV